MAIQPPYFPTRQDSLPPTSGAIPATPKKQNPKPAKYGNRSGAYKSDGTEGSMRRNFAANNSLPYTDPRENQAKNSLPYTDPRENRANNGQGAPALPYTDPKENRAADTEYGNRGGAYQSDGTEGSMRQNFADANPDPMYGPPAPAFPQEEYGNREGAYTSDGTEGSMRKNFAVANQTPQGNQSFGRDAMGGSFNNPETQGKFNQAMRPQAPAAPAQAAQGGQEDLVKNWAKYHGKGPKNAYNEKSSADRAMLAAMQEAQRTGQSVSRVANGALSTEGRRAAGKLIPYSKNPNSIYAKGR